MMELTWSKEIQEALAAPFPEDEIEFLPKSPANGRALALAYIDARSVMRRLDAVVGPRNWWFDFDVLDLSPGRGGERGAVPTTPKAFGVWVKGRLTVLGVTKCDAGEAVDEDEALKAAVSDALKRCAVHFGIGRYLYYLPRLWAPYDSARRRFIEPPRLPTGARERALAICGYIPIPKAFGTEPGTRASELGTRDPEPRISNPDSPESRKPTPNGSSDASLECSNPACGKALTRGQYEVSLRGFGRPLCPACQRQQASVRTG
ncbi:MAG: hypothetical protein HY320_00580 [Armatimonadetes bacterium]|nr:hypothetical protein [Armatimonadota bacterium]